MPPISSRRDRTRARDARNHLPLLAPARTPTSKPGGPLIKRAPAFEMHKFASAHVARTPKVSLQRQLLRLA
eukprot:1572862-Pleurochrysis_carterae.AAC.1